MLHSPYVSRVGPEHGPVPFDFTPPRIEVYAAAGQSPVGIAQARGCICYLEGQAMLFRLIVDGAEMAGLWVCDGRRFVLLEGGE